MTMKDKLPSIEELQQKLQSGSPVVIPQGWEVSYLPSMDMNITYYLGGPMRGYPEHNWPAFRAACEQLRAAGLKIISPHEVNPAANQDPSVANPDVYVYPLKYLKTDIEAMIKCDGLILLKGWPKSRGAKAELSIALDLEYPVYFYDNYQIVSMQ